jgi:hypothetical protein
MEFFCDYLRTQRKNIFAFLLFAVILLVSFLLYQLPLYAVLYPLLLCGGLGVFFLLCGWRDAWRKHQQLTAMCTPSAALLGELPAAESAWEADYQALLLLLREEQDRILQEDARHYNDMVDYYTTWAHQIKTPIASMRLHLQNEDNALSRQLTADLFRVEQYVEMVLMFLRLDSAENDYVFQTCELDALVRSCIKKFAGEFIRRKIRLEYVPISARVVTDEKWLAFVIEQILSNALKYTPEGGTVSVTLEEPQTLCIRDTGIGIAAEDLPRIFEKGYTGWNGRADRTASGIGLYLCRRICDALEHTLRAESAPECGTCMKIGLARQKLILE